MGGYSVPNGIRWVALIVIDRGVIVYSIPQRIINSGSVEIYAGGYII
jgi:hypothetical protein